MKGIQQRNQGDFIAPEADFSLSQEEIMDMVRQSIQRETSPPDRPSAPPRDSRPAGIYMADAISGSADFDLAEMTHDELVRSLLPGRVQQED